MGSYIVIAPGIALPHARPEDGVNFTAISIVYLEESVPFGHPDNDPVKLVIGLSAKDKEAHVKALSQLATIMETSDLLHIVANTNTLEKLYRKILRLLE